MIRARNQLLDDFFDGIPHSDIDLPSNQEGERVFYMGIAKRQRCSTIFASSSGSLSWVLAVVDTAWISIRDVL